MSVEWIEHKGTQILVLDYQGMPAEAIIAEIERGQAIVEEGPVPPPTRIRVLYNFEQAQINAAVMVRLIQQGQQVLEARTEKSAILGIQGPRNILLTAYNRATGAGDNQQVFDNWDDALNWLAT
jgi:hypothetical protein